MSKPHQIVSMLILDVDNLRGMIKLQLDNCVLECLVLIPESSILVLEIITRQALGVTVTILITILLRLICGVVSNVSHRHIVVGLAALLIA